MGGSVSPNHISVKDSFFDNGLLATPAKSGNDKALQAEKNRQDELTALYNKKTERLRNKSY